MASKNSNLYGGIAAVAALLLVIVLLRKRFRWGLLLMNVLVGAGEKWRERRELNRIRSILDQVD